MATPMHETGAADEEGRDKQQEQHDERRMYLRFAAMIATSTVVMSS